MSAAQTLYREQNAAIFAAGRAGAVGAQNQFPSAHEHFAGDQPCQAIGPRGCTNAQADYQGLATGSHKGRYNRVIRCAIENRPTMFCLYEAFRR
jgi:hypothetical protein